VIDLDTLAVLRGQVSRTAVDLVRDHIGEIQAAWDQLNP